MVAILSFGLGLWIASQASHKELPASRVRRRYARGVRLLTAISLVVFGWIIHSVGWSRLVRTNWGMGDLGLLNDVVVFLPFLLIQLLVWWGQFFADRALQLRAETATPAQLARYLFLRARQSLGLILPVILLFILRRDIFGRLRPDWDESALAEPIEIAALGSLVLIVAPLFVRLAWPTRPLPDGPLRRRLERVARRAGFRFADVLIWDTENTVLNACVTGILPRFRLRPAHGCPGRHHDARRGGGGIRPRDRPHRAPALALFRLLLRRQPGNPHPAGRRPGPGVGMGGERAGVVRVGLAAGRRGSAGSGRACAVWACTSGWSSATFRDASSARPTSSAAGLSRARPGTVRLTSTPTATLGRHLSGGSPLPLCRVGLRTFSEALAIVAQCNGMELARRSWRHGSIASRIAFLESLERRPDLERHFQRQVARMRLVLGVVMVLALIAAALRQAVAA